MQLTENTPSYPGRIGVSSSDQMHVRVLESAIIHLGFVPVVVAEEGALRAIDNDELELVIAEPETADKLMARVLGERQADDPYRPAIIAVVSATDGIVNTGEPTLYDGVLSLPQQPAALAAQLSIAIYAHRAFARRFENTLDELKLHRQVFHSVTSGVSVASITQPDMPLTYVNPAFEVLSGYSLEEVIGKNCRFLQGDERDQPGLVLVREAIAKGLEARVILKNFRKDGTLFWNELSLSPIRDRQGKITAFVGIQTDVTTRMEFELALRESEKLAVAGRLAASIAHEINNPLESITNLVYLAQHSETLEENRTYLAQLDDELRRIKLITAQSLRFTRQSTKPQAIHLNELLDLVLDVAKARMLAAGVRIERRDRPTRQIVCMESEIRQVMHNLIRNATDAVKAKGGGRVLMRTAEVSTLNRSGVVLTVADTGTGIAAKNLATIFQAFFSTKGDQGTGLGLWITSEIVKRHHGTVRVRSRTTGTSTGTVFRIYLPFEVALAGSETSDKVLPAQ